MSNAALIYTPIGIPVGQPIMHEDGTLWIRVKKPKENIFDEISLDALIAEAFRKTIVAESRTFVQGLATE